MTRQVIRNVSGVLVLLGACSGKVQTPTDPEPGPAPVADAGPVQPEEEPPLPKFLPGEPIVEVSGEVASFPSVWLFDPRGDFVAERGNPWMNEYEPNAAETQQFTLFEIETGARVGTFECGELEEDPCRDWILPDDPRRPSPDLAMHAIPDGADIELHTSSDPASAAVDEIPCPGCRDVVSLAWSPDGSQLAVTRAGKPRVELWNIASKQKVSTLKLDGKHRYEGEVRVGWSSEGLSAMAERKPSTDEENYMYNPYSGDDVPYGYDMALPVLHTWSDPGAAPKVTVLDPGGKSDHLEANDEIVRFRNVVLDPLGRFVWGIETDWGSRESIGERLAVHSLGSASSDLFWDGTHVPWGPGDQWYPADDDDRGRWSATTHAQWHRATTLASDWDERLKIEVAAISLGETPRKWLVTLDPTGDEYETVVNVEADQYLVAGVSGGKPVVYGRTCFTPRKWDPKTDKPIDSARVCKGEPAPVVPDCELVEFSPDAEWMMVECGNAMKIAPRHAPTKAVALPASSARSTWSWRSGGLVIDDGEGHVAFVDPVTGKASDRLDDARLVAAPLSAELGRVLVQVGDTLEVRDATSREVLHTVEAEGAMYAAFSPDGKQLAYTDEEHIAVADLATGKTRLRWKVAEVHGVAWRHDGEALLSATKDGLPRQAWDPSTGKLAPELALDSGVLDGLTPEDLDPSWRFAIDTDGNVMRLLDGVVLEDLETDNPVTSNGWHAREVPAKHRYVVHSDPLAYRVLKPADVTPYVVRKSLLRDFMAGHPLPPPTWPEDKPIPKRKTGKPAGQAKAPTKAPAKTVASK